MSRKPNKYGHRDYVVTEEGAGHMHAGEVLKPKQRIRLRTAVARRHPKVFAPAGAPAAVKTTGVVDDPKPK